MRDENGTESYCIITFINSRKLIQNLFITKNQLQDLNEKKPRQLWRKNDLQAVQNYAFLIQKPLQIWIRR